MAYTVYILASRQNGILYIGNIALIERENPHWEGQFEGLCHRGMDTRVKPEYDEGKAGRIPPIYR